MKKTKKGAISIFALLSMMFFLIFIMVAYNNVMQKGKNQVELEEILVDYYKPFQMASEITDAQNGGDRIKMTDLRGNEQKFEMLKSANNGKYIYSNGKIYKIEANKKEYQQVEYIESSGEQFIDTGFIPNQDTRIVADFEYTRNNQGYRFTGSEKTSPVSQLFRFGTSVGVYWLLGYNKQYAYVGNCDMERHVLDFNKNRCFLDESLLYEFTYESFDGYVNAYIFSVNSNSIADLTHCKLYSYKLYDNEELIRDYIPCYRVSDDEIGLYDLVNDVFYPNAGSGKFTKGPDV